MGTRLLFKLHSSLKSNRVPVNLTDMRLNSVHRLLLALLVVVVYGQSLRFEFVNLDDATHLRNNPYLQPVSLKNTLQLWEKPYKGLYIPVTYTTWALVAAIAPPQDQKASAKYFHALNVLMHLLLILCIVYPFLKVLLGNSTAAFWGAALFAIHPIQVEAVTWVSGFKDVLSGMLGLGALYAYYLFCLPPKSPWNRLLFPLSSFLFVLAALAKPSTLVLPLIAACIVRMKEARHWRLVAKEMGIWIALALPVIGMTWIAQPTATLEFTPPNFGGRLLIAADTLRFYVFKILFPWPLQVDYGRTPDVALSSPWLWPSVLFTALLFLALIASLQKTARPKWEMGTLFLVLALLPVLGFKPFIFQTTSTVADRYLYIGLFGIAVIAGSYWQKKRNVLYFALLLLLTLTSFFQVKVWENSFTLLHHAYKRNPKSWLAANNLGSAYEMARDYKKAFHYYHQATRLRPSVVGYNSLGIVQLKRKDPNAAIRVYKDAIAKGYGAARIYFNMGLAWRALDNEEQANVAFHKARQLRY